MSKKIFHELPYNRKPEILHESDLNPAFAVIEDTDRAKDEIGTLHNEDQESHVTEITVKEIQALLSGKCLAINVNDEYIQYVTVRL